VIKVTRSAVIDAPIGVVWSLIRDFNSHWAWHPAVGPSRIERDEPADQVGCVRNFALKDGNRIREQLIALSDREHFSTYCILDATLPMRRYVATVRLSRVTDGDRTFWHWQSTFDVPRGREREFAELVGRGVYEAGFQGVRDWLRANGGRPWSMRDQGPSRDGGGIAEAIARGPAAGRARGPVAGQAVFVERHGGPDVLALRATSAPPPGPGEARIRQTAIGINYIDIYVRKGLYPLLTPPAVPGMEAAGIVVDVGEGVSNVAPGDRVAYACAPPGSYATVRTMPAAPLVKLPARIDDETAAAAMLKGLSAEYLLFRLRRVGAGDTILVHAAAGGVGLLLCQWASRLGATVLGTVSTEDKARTARAHGCAHPIVAPDARFADRVLELTSGRGADVVYDGLGADAADENLRAVATTGLWVSYGQATGPLPPIDPARLEARSISLARPVLFHFTEDPRRLAEMSARLFDAIERNLLTVRVGGRWPLGAAADAHRALGSRGTRGSLLLLP
jgi:NADPH:quinone reductase-like Zn-dependent oxidoreductase